MSLYRPLLLIAILILVPLAGCVETSRTEKSRYGNPLDSYSSTPNNQFDADNWEPPKQKEEPGFFERLFDWF